MKERPLLFSGAMVRALLDGSKTQTRRAIKLPHANPLGQWEATSIGGGAVHDSTGTKIPHQGAIWHTRTGEVLASPHGQPGDRLWVREAWAKTNVAQARGAQWIVYREGDNRTDYGGPWKPSIHMPRAACRILLEITGVRVERLQDISEADARAEGIDACDGLGTTEAILDLAKRMGTFKQAVLRYATLWESINGAGSWDANPFVWVIEFRRVS